MVRIWEGGWREGVERVRGAGAGGDGSGFAVREREVRSCVFGEAQGRFMAPAHGRWLAAEGSFLYAIGCSVKLTMAAPRGCDVRAALWPADADQRPGRPPGSSRLKPAGGHCAGGPGVGRAISRSSSREAFEGGRRGCSGPKRQARKSCKTFQNITTF